MSYFNKLKADKEAKDKYEKEEFELKQAIFDINNIYSQLDGEFLRELQQFIKKYKQ